MIDFSVCLIISCRSCIICSYKKYGGSVTDSENNDGSLIIVTEPNVSDNLRTGTITVTTEEGIDTISVYQDGLNSQLSLSKSSISATANGKEETIDVTSNVSWLALSDAEWVVLDYSIGIGDDELTVIVDSNYEPAPRTATITITGEGVVETITITQAAYQEVSDATLSELTVSEGELYPAFIPGAKNYKVAVPYTTDTIAISATLHYPGASVTGTGTKNLTVGANIFTVTVTAQDGITTKEHVITVTREHGPCSLLFSEEYYWIDAYVGSNSPVYIYAYVEDEQGAEITAPELVSMVYTSDFGVSNSTGIFTKEDLDILPDEETYVTATATLSDGTILQEVVLVVAPLIEAR